MKNQAEHGMNAVTGGPSALLRGVRDGRADIDYSRMERWMALAKKYGFTCRATATKDSTHLARHITALGT